ncbi:hypothetical protein QBC40DRAFT_325923 [Triangularia verruculosa]|uniref:Aerolysin-like C-terminal domain-containing protein n=1 Tax=Triangularia verruculosa TaxID=2587418 RepID=A0AAN6XN60_9PEZI|nr:hypothetical protein QBC40DRAFT_325923 [Triangularia verruculosa]
MTQAAQRLQISEDSGTAETSDGKPTFGHLFIIFNQFRLNPNDTPESLKAKLIDEEEEDDEASTNRNAIRKLLVSVFESIRVIILPNKVKQEALDALESGRKKFLLLDDFLPVYHQYFATLRRTLSECLKTPRELTPDRPLSGGATADFMPLFVDAINKSEPLNIPSIFEAARKEAIAKAKLAFSSGLSHITEGYTNDQEPKPTSMLITLFDKDVGVLVGQVAVTLSMSSTVAQQAQKECTEQLAAPARDALVAANMTRLKSLLAAALIASLTQLNDGIDSKFSEIDSRLIPGEKVGTVVQEVLTVVTAALKTKAEFYDPAAMPEKWNETLAAAAESITQVGRAWAAWATQVKDQCLNELTAALVKLNAEVELGDDDQYKSKAALLFSESKRTFENKLSSEYAGETILEMQQGIRNQNRDTVLEQLRQLKSIIELDYKEQLRQAVTPNVEPVDFTTATNDTPFSNRFAQFCESNNISKGMRDEAELELKSFFNQQKTDFRSLYNQACEEFGDYLDSQLKSQTPPLLLSFNSDLDKINLDLPKSTVSGQCDAKSNEIIAQFDALKSKWNLQPDGVVSKDILAAARRALVDTLTTGKKAILDKYDEVVSAYNKALLSGVVVPIVDKCTGNLYANINTLANDVNNARVTYFNKCHGDPSTDATSKWEGFEKSTYPSLQEIVRRFNAYVVPGLTQNEAISKEIEKHIIGKIWIDCANIGNRLHMSYIAPSLFTGKPEDKGLKPKEGKEAKENDREWRMTNINIDNPQNDDMYQPWRSTNLEFFQWTVEISEIMWGTPIITEIKPFKLNTSKYSAQDKDMVVDVGTIDTITTTTTDSFTWGVTAGGEYSYSWGNKATVGEETFKASFGVKFDTTHMNSVATTYTMSTLAHMTLPAGRANVIHQMVFDQRTTLPYTAKVRVIPRLRLQNGYTTWGGGGSYRNNPKTGAIKDSFKDGDRTYRDFDFKRVDEIREDARNNSDPWYWQLACSSERDPYQYLNDALDHLADPEMTKVYVKGKWEGITGKYAVTTVVPEATNLTLLPPGV